MPSTPIECESVYQYHSLPRTCTELHCTQDFSHCVYYKSADTYYYLTAIITSCQSLLYFSLFFDWVWLASLKVWKDYWFETATWNLESVMCEWKIPNEHKPRWRDFSGISLLHPGSTVSTWMNSLTCLLNIYLCKSHFYLCKFHQKHPKVIKIT